MLDSLVPNWLKPRSAYFRLLELPVEVIERIFEEIKKNRDRIISPCRILQQLCNQCSFYFVDIYAYQIGGLLNAVEDNLGLLKLIKVLTIREEEEENYSERDLGVLLSLVNEVKLLTLGLTGFNLGNQILSMSYEGILPHLDNLSFLNEGRSRGGVVSARRLGDFLDNHPLVQTLSITKTRLASTNMQNNDVSLFEGIINLEIIWERNEFSCILNFLAPFTKLKSLSLDIINRSHLYPNSSTSEFLPILSIIISTELKTLKLGSLKNFSPKPLAKPNLRLEYLYNIFPKFNQLEFLHSFYPILATEDITQLVDILPKLKVLECVGVKSLIGNEEEKLKEKLQSQKRNLIFNFGDKRIEALNGVDGDFKVSYINLKSFFLVWLLATYCFFTVY